MDDYAGGIGIEEHKVNGTIIGSKRVEDPI
jgi:hypothetical protein